MPYTFDTVDKSWDTLQLGHWDDDWISNNVVLDNYNKSAPAGPSSTNNTTTEHTKRNINELINNDPYINSLLEQMNYLKRSRKLTPQNEILLQAEISGRIMFLNNG
jgi:hypothetical protein